MKSKLIILLFCIPLLSSCDDMFEPALENIYDENMMHSQPTFAQGKLMLYCHILLLRRVI